MKWENLKKKRRVDWYMDKLVFEKALELAKRRGYNSLQKYLEKLLIDELKADQIAQDIMRGI